MRDCAELCANLCSAYFAIDCHDCVDKNICPVGGEKSCVFMKAADAIDELSATLRDCKNELCLLCGRYKERHKGACSDCRWRDKDAEIH